MKFHKNILDLDCEAEVERICEFIRQQVREMKRDGIVIGLSGGVDSALAAALSVRAMGKENVLGVILPERDSNPKSAEFACEHAKQMGIETITMDLTPMLEAFGTYEKRDDVVRQVFPEYNENCRFKITLPQDLLGKDALNFFTLNMDDGSGEVKKKRLKKDTLWGIVAATNTKQRSRMTALYYQAERRNYLVCGTTNRSETVQGFFVQFGDGGVDIEPLAHRYKVQVYQMAEHLGVLQEIIDRPPSPDTYTFPVSDEEFYFRIPRDKLDLLLYAWENKIETIEICKVMDLNEAQVKRAFRDFNSKFNATQHMRQMPPTLE